MSSETAQLDKHSVIGDFDIVGTYLTFLKEDPDITKPIAAIESLVKLIQKKEPSTQAELINLLEVASSTLKNNIANSISLSAGCDLFSRFILRNLHLYSDWESCKQHLGENGQLFLSRSKEARTKIAKTGFNFIRDDDVLLIHGYSRVIFHMLQYAFDRHVRFRIVLTESKPSSQGITFSKRLKAKGIPTALIHDSSVGYIINKVDKVLVGAEGVAESGGIINNIGTFQIALLAKNFNKPVYVAAESHKFVRLYPLGPDDLQLDVNPLNFKTDNNSSNSNTSDSASSSGSSNSSSEDIVNNESKSLEGDNSEEEQDLIQHSPKLDFTSHEYITALITDLGVLTPGAVSEELIKMWYD